MAWEKAKGDEMRQATKWPIFDAYKDVYFALYGKRVDIIHVGGGWYYVQPEGEWDTKDLCSKFRPSDFNKMTENLQARLDGRLSS